VIHTTREDPSDIDDIPFRLPLSESSSSQTTKQLRPTYVPLPSPRSFEMDAHPTSTSYGSNLSNQSFSPLVAFDSSYTRGSPTASSPAINVEHGLPVLVVDDDKLTRTLMKRILTRLGCIVSTAENGEMALEMILGTKFQHALTPSSDASENLGPILEQEREPPELTEESRYAVVFLDNQMPIMSGLKAVEKLRQMGRKDLIVGVTGKSHTWAI
jgi:osomolarity two-component system, sensor histidine kinase SLN1